MRRGRLARCTSLTRRHGFNHRLYEASFRETLSAEDRQKLRGDAEAIEGEGLDLPPRFFADNWFADRPADDRDGGFEGNLIRVRERGSRWRGAPDVDEAQYVRGVGWGAAADLRSRGGE